MTRGVGLVLVAGVLLCSGADASKPVRPPTTQDLATVWVGGGPSSLEFLRLELRENGRGLLTVQYLPTQGAQAYRITRVLLAKYSVTFSLEPAESGAEPIYLRGTAIPGRLTLELGGKSQKWKRKVELEPLSRLMERIQAVTTRAEEIEKASQ